VTTGLPSVFGEPRTLLKSLASEQHRLWTVLLPTRRIADCQNRFSETLTGANLRELIVGQLGSRLPDEDDLVIDECLAMPQAAFSSVPENTRDTGPDPANRIHETSPQRQSSTTRIDVTKPRTGMSSGGSQGRNERVWTSPTPELKTASMRPGNLPDNDDGRLWPDHLPASIPSRALTHANPLARAIQRYWQRERNAIPVAPSVPPISNGTARAPFNHLQTGRPGRTTVGLSGQPMQAGASVAEWPVGQSAVGMPDGASRQTSNAASTATPPDWQNGSPGPVPDDNLAGRMADVLFKQALLHGIDVT